ncbi:MAG: response regulator, partial [Caldilineaceae bacterium]|nr:response regulator [Caldilineaceae bacterium]
MARELGIQGNPIEILLIEDNPGDVRLIMEIFRESAMENRVAVVKDGVEAMAYLHKAGEYRMVNRPDLILLDLNLPRKDGRTVLSEIKGDPDLHSIPVIVLTSSDAEEDIRRAYELRANCYI